MYQYNLSKHTHTRTDTHTHTYTHIYICHCTLRKLDQTGFIGGDKHTTTHRILLGKECTYKWNTV